MKRQFSVEKPLIKERISYRNLWDYIKVFNIHVIETPEGKQNTGGRKTMKKKWLSKSPTLIRNKY